MPLDTGVPRQVLAGAWSGAKPSSDGSKAVFRRGKSMFVATLVDGRASEVAGTEGFTPQFSFDWTDGDRRIVYLLRSNSGNQTRIEAYDLESRRSTTIVSDTGIAGLSSAGDDRLVYSKTSSEFGDNESNLWDIRIDPRTGEPKGEPRQLTRWSGFGVSLVSASRDGRHLFAVGHRWRSDVYIADVTGPAAGAPPPARLTLEWRNRPTAWTSDGRTVLFDSNRNGEMDIYQQHVNSRLAQRVIADGNFTRGARPSPDGNWMLYLAWPQEHGEIRRAEGRLMRVANGSAVSETVMRVGGFAVFNTTHPEFRCPSDPKSDCVISEYLQEKLVFTAFNTLAGRGREIARFSASSDSPWDVSPDGQWLAVARGRGRIQLLPLSARSVEPRNIFVAGELWFTGLAWAHDGKAIYATVWSSFGETLWRVLLSGAAELLYRGSKHVRSPVPSPDGRYVAFTNETADANGWLIEPIK